MIPYSAPLKDMEFVLNDLGLIDFLLTMPKCDDATKDLVNAVLAEAKKLDSDVIAPLNYSGDKEGASIENGIVRVPTGYTKAYHKYCGGGWNAVPFDPDYGGQGLPMTISAVVNEMWQSANMAWALCPLLNQGAIEAVQQHATQELKDIYLAKMIEGTWSGTMNLTEPQAGSDLALLKTKATPQGDHYRIKGQKIFITYGEHEMSENIVHLVLARLPDAPEGVRGISLFLCPKYLPKKDGSIGDRNDLKVVSLEHKCGIAGSPTCVMSYGDNDGAIGYLLGEENNGLACMFTMMNNARLAVAQQGLCITERAYQQARDFAKERKQGNDTSGNRETVTIINHPDVRRMLMTMRAHAEAQRALLLDTMSNLDGMHHHPEKEWRDWCSRRVDLMTPVLKGWFTESAVEMASLGVQVHGGMGFIEETGAAQHYRDARILPIYEGTTGIQAADLVGRKILRDKGEAAFELMDELDAIINRLNNIQSEEFAVLRKHFGKAVDMLGRGVDWVLDSEGKDMDAVLASSTYLLKLFGIVMGGKMMIESAMVAQAKLDKNEGDAEFYKMKLVTARFYAENILNQASGLLGPITQGHNTVMALKEDQF